MVNKILTRINNGGIIANKKQGEHKYESELIFKALYVHVLQTYTAISTLQGYCIRL